MNPLSELRSKLIGSKKVSDDKNGKIENVLIHNTLKRGQYYMWLDKDYSRVEIFNHVRETKKGNTLFNMFRGKSEKEKEKEKELKEKEFEYSQLRISMSKYLSINDITNLIKLYILMIMIKYTDKSPNSWDELPAIDVLKCLGLELLYTIHDKSTVDVVHFIRLGCQAMLIQRKHIDESFEQFIHDKKCMNTFNSRIDLEPTFGQKYSKYSLLVDDILKDNDLTERFKNLGLVYVSHDKQSRKDWNGWEFYKNAWKVNDVASTFSGKDISVVMFCPFLDEDGSMNHAFELILTEKNPYTDKLLSEYVVTLNG